MSKVFTPPLLKPKDIVSTLATLDIQLAADQLENPQNLQKAYEFFMEWLMGVAPDDFDIAGHNDAARELQTPMLYDEAVRKLALIRHLPRLFEAVCISDYDYQRDHAQPTTKRVVFNLSAIINFARFREECLPRYEALTEESDDVVEKKHRLTAENENLKLELENLKLQRAAAEPQIKILTAETDELAKEMKEKNSIQANLNTETRKIKADIEAMKTKLKGDQETLANLKLLVRRLKGQIIDSPEKTKKYIEELGVEVEKEKEEIASLQRKHRELSTRLDVLHKVERDIVKTTEAMQGCQHEREKSKSFRMQIKEKKLRIEELQRQQRELEEEMQHMQRQLQLANERSLCLTDQFRLKLQAAEDNKDEAMRDRTLRMKEAAAARDVVRKTEEEIRSYEQSITNLKRTHNKDMTRLKEVHVGMENSVREYHNRLFATMQAPVTI